MICKYVKDIKYLLTNAEKLKLSKKVKKDIKEIGNSSTDQDQYNLIEGLVNINEVYNNIINDIRRVVKNPKR